MPLDLPDPRPPRLIHLALGAILAAGLIAGVPAGLAAQEPAQPDQRDTTADSVATRSTTISPGSGRAGTRVIVEGQLLPAVTPVRITIGGTRSGFESVAQLMTDRYGSIRDTVEVPSWVERHRTYKFFVVDIYFEPLSESGVFHATDSDGAVVREGRLIDDEGECPTMRGEDGELYTLTGETAALEAGSTLIVEGTIARSGPCVRGTTLEVEQLLPAAPTS